MKSTDTWKLLLFENIDTWKVMVLEKYWYLKRTDTEKVLILKKYSYWRSIDALIFEKPWYLDIWKVLVLWCLKSFGTWYFSSNNTLQS